MVKELSSAVVVVTGASSGIGRATAEAFARRGATVVCAARREASLKEVAAECDRLGGRGRPYVVDVTDEDAVRELARWTVEHHGRIDVWVNNASVYLLGRFDETPADAFRRVIDVNLFGYVHGMRAALPFMRHQDGGVIVNVASMDARMPEPYSSAYSASKGAVRALSAAVRAELIGTNVHICTVNPASIDTPIFQHAANYMGRRIKAINPVNDARWVADAIVGLAERPRSEVMIGTPGVMMSLLHAVLPGLAEKQVKTLVDADHFGEPEPTSDGNLYQPLAEGSEVSGGWPVTAPPPVAAKLLAAGAGAALAAVPVALLARRGR